MRSRTRRLVVWMSTRRCNRNVGWVRQYYIGIVTHLEVDPLKEPVFIEDFRVSGWEAHLTHPTPD